MLLGSLTVGLAVPAAAADGSWSSLSIPQAGALGNYVLVPSPDGMAGLSTENISDVGPSLLTKNKDGSIMYVNWNIGEGTLGSNLYKTTDGARTWIRCSTVNDDLGDVQITQIVTSPQDANRVYVSTREYNAETDIMSDQIYRSTDAGATFVRIITPTDESAGNLPIFSMAVGYNGSHYLYIATTVEGNGDVFQLQDVFGGDWESTNYADNLPYRVVTKVFVSPNFATEAQPMVGALSFFDGDSFVSFSYGGAAWASVAGDDVQFADDEMYLYDGYVLVPAGVGFPSDFDSRRSARDFFIGVTGYNYDGDVYRIIASTALPMGLELDVTSIGVSGPAGNCKLLAAGTYDFNVYHSENNGDTWTPSQKDPPQITGTTSKFLVMDGSYNTNGKAWIAVAAGSDFDDAGISQTLDFGVTWTDFSLLNTTIGVVTNITPSPAYATDTSLFMIVTGVQQDSVWKWDGKYWTRVYVLPLGSAAGAIIQCSPSFSSDKTVFLANTISGQIYRATDTGFWFKPQVTCVPGTFNGAMMALSSTKILVGTDGGAAITANNGTTWDTIGLGVGGVITSFAVAADNKTLLLGTDGAYALLSTDTGASWKQVPAGAKVYSSGGATNVSFDPSYATNNMIYAAVAGISQIYSLNTATGTSWGALDYYVTMGGAFNSSPLVPGVQMAKDGTLYVFDKTGVGTGTVGSADSFVILSTTNATGSLVITGGKVTVTRGGTATVNGGITAVTSGTAPAIISYALINPNDYITVSCNTAPANGTWSLATGSAVAAMASDADVDSSVAMVPGTFHLTDSTTSAGTGSTHVVLRALSGAGRYLWDALPSSFATLGGLSGNLRGLWENETTNGPQIWTLESGSTSRIWTYTDRLTGKTTLNSPANNASVGRIGQATLVWTAMPTATYYQIQISTVNTFASTLVDTVSGLMATSYVAAGLDNGITYYWRVRSAHTGLTPAGKAASNWSDTWAFTMGLGAAQWDPFVPAERVNPIPASYNVPLRPTFLWNPADWATGYEFVLSKAADFSNPIYTFTGATALKITAFVADKDLEFGTDYYWKVTAISATSKSNTAYGSFRTMLQPTVAPPGPTLTVPAPVNITIPPQQNITPTWIWAIVIIGAVLVIAVIILIVTTRRVP